MRVLHEIVGGLCSIAIILAAFGFVGGGWPYGGDYADALITEAMEKEARPKRRAHAELLCGCPKVHRGQWLRLQVTHQPDREFCRAVCVYDGGAVTKGIP